MIIYAANDLFSNLFAPTAAETTEDRATDSPQDPLEPDRCTDDVVHVSSATTSVHVRLDPAMWTAVPAGRRATPRRTVEEWARVTAARYLVGTPWPTRDEPFLRHRLLELADEGHESPGSRTYVHHADLRLATLTISLDPGTPAARARYETFGRQQRLGTEVRPYGSLGVCTRDIAFAPPGNRELGEIPSGSLTCRWRLDASTELVVEVRTRCAEKLLRMLPTIDVVLDTLEPCPRIERPARWPPIAKAWAAGTDAPVSRRDPEI